MRRRSIKGHWEKKIIFTHQKRRSYALIGSWVLISIISSLFFFFFWSPAATQNYCPQRLLHRRRQVSGSVRRWRRHAAAMRCFCCPATKAAVCCAPPWRQTAFSFWSGVMLYVNPGGAKKKNSSRQDIYAVTPPLVFPFNWKKTSASAIFFNFFNPPTLRALSLFNAPLQKSIYRFCKEKW